MNDLAGRIIAPGLNYLIRKESWAQERLRQRAGASLLVVAGLIRISLGVDGSGLFHAVSDTTQPPAVTLRLPADAPAKFLLDRENLFSSVRIEGSADVAETLAFVFRNLSWDAEGDLANLIGDIAARRLVMTVRALAEGIQSSLRRSLANVSEYVRDESDWLSNRNELVTFYSAVDQLRDDMERLEKRIARL